MSLIVVPAPAHRRGHRDAARLRRAGVDLAQLASDRWDEAVAILRTGGDLASLHRRKPGHAAVLTFVPGPPWQEAAWWEPARAGTRFPPLPPPS